MLHCKILSQNGRHNSKDNKEDTLGPYLHGGSVPGEDSNKVMAKNPVVTEVMVTGQERRDNRGCEAS